MGKVAKNIAILGAGGSMGLWFAKYFLSLKYNVTGFDSEKEIKVKNVINANSLVGAILTADYVILCTPARKTPEIIRLIAKEMKRGAYLVDIASQKSKTSSALAKIPAKISPICIHPMFGPGTSSIKGKNVISIPIRDAKKELTVTKQLLAGANFVTIDANEHDKRIASILGLTHMVNLIFANIISKDEKSGLTDKMSGVTFKTQKILAESILTESPQLIESIISNPELRRIAEEFWKDMGRMLTSVQDTKIEEIVNYINTCKERLDANSDVTTSVKKMKTISRVLEK
ncbi:MAG: Prephenate dehydrogenase [Cenarchaeum symbiont of Oopsacas minuta]|nr:Prephenate dehydrogenase [Cenarchaeum symbiont of Oopsacas minuta]